MSDLVPLLIGLIGTLIGASPMLIRELAGRRKASAEGTSVLVQTALNLLPAQGSMITELQARLAAAQADADDWHKKYTKANACAQTFYYFCIDNNLIPPCTPDGVTGKLQ